MRNTVCTIPECGRATGGGRRLCDAHNSQKRRGVPFKPVVPLSTTSEERFWSHVDKSGECWIWTGGRSQGGYGGFAIRVDGRMTTIRANRYSYQMAHGPIPRDMVTDHTCHNRACVNPEHLRLVTIKQNAENVLGPNKNSKTGVRGVHWNTKARRYIATVNHNRMRVFSRYFDNLDEAAFAVVEARNRVFTHNDVDRAS